MASFSVLFNTQFCVNDVHKMTSLIDKKHFGSSKHINKLCFWSMQICTTNRVRLKGTRMVSSMWKGSAPPQHWKTTARLLSRLTLLNFACLKAQDQYRSFGCLNIAVLVNHTITPERSRRSYLVQIKLAACSEREYWIKIAGQKKIK